MVSSRLLASVALGNLCHAVRIQSEDEQQILGESHGTLETHASNLVDGLSGAAILDITEIARSLTDKQFQELAEIPRQLCPSEGRRCAPVFRQDLHTAHAAFSWEPGDHLAADFARIAEHGLMVSNVAVIRSVDGIFTNDDSEYFQNRHGFWHSVLSTFTCQSAEGDFRASLECEDNEQRTWYVFVGTRGTGGATEVMAQFGLYEDVASSEFLNVWERHHIGGSLDGGFARHQLTHLLANLTNPLVDVSEEHYPWWNDVSQQDQHIPPATMEKLVATSDPQGGLRQLTNDVRGWASVARELVANDARELVEALHMLYVPGHNQNSDWHQANRHLFCDNSWLGDIIADGIPACPAEDATSTTSFVFSGHSFGGVAAQLQGVVAEASEEVETAVIAINSPGVHYLSKQLELRNPRHSWRNGLNDWWNNTFGTTRWLPISRVEVDEVQDYSRFLLLVSQHDVIWKVDRPLSKLGQAVCMYYHAPSDTHCANYTDFGLIVDASCDDNSRSRLEPRCADFQACMEKEHFFDWEGTGGLGLNGLRNKPLDTGLLMTDLIDATGKALYNPSHPGMPAEAFAEYKAGHDIITAEFEARLAPSTAIRDANLSVILSRYEPNLIKVSDLDEWHCCDFNVTTDTCNRIHNDTVRTPCTGENMVCSRVHTDFDSFTTHRFKNKCECQSGWHYSLENDACVIEDSAGNESVLAAWYANEVWEAEWIRKGELFHLDQNTEFGTLDANFYGADETGKWRCTEPGDDSWKDGMLGALGRVIFGH